MCFSFSSCSFSLRYRSPISWRFFFAVYVPPSLSAHLAHLLGDAPQRPGTELEAGEARVALLEDLLAAVVPDGVSVLILLLSASASTSRPAWRSRCSTTCRRRSVRWATTRRRCTWLPVLLRAYVKYSQTRSDSAVDASQNSSRPFHALYAARPPLHAPRCPRRRRSGPRDSSRAGCRACWSPSLRATPLPDLHSRLVSFVVAPFFSEKTP